MKRFLHNNSWFIVRCLIIAKNLKLSVTNYISLKHHNIVSIESKYKYIFAFKKCKLKSKAKFSLFLSCLLNITTPQCSEPFGTLSLSLCLREHFGSKTLLLQLQSIQAVFFLDQQPEDTKANGNALLCSEFIFIIAFLRLSRYFNILLSSFHTNRTASILRLPV